jgi:hypothetical protein
LFFLGNLIYLILRKYNWNKLLTTLPFAIFFFFRNGYSLFGISSSLFRSIHQITFWFYDLRAGPREYRPISAYIGCGKILDFEFDCAIWKPIKSYYENPNMNSFWLIYKKMAGIIFFQSPKNRVFSILVVFFDFFTHNLMVWGAGRLKW